MPYLGVIGELVEVDRRCWMSEELDVEWWIRDILALPGESGDCYFSPDFNIGDERWRLSVWPDWERERLNKASGWVALGLCRRDGGPPKTFRFSVGIWGSGGVEMSREGEKEFRGIDYCDWKDFCSRSDLVEHETRLMPEGILTIKCVLKRVLPGELPPVVLDTYSYEELQTATQDFCDRNKIGEGGFGTVYRAVIRGDVVAVKRLKDPVDKQFITELKTLIVYKHENLLSLLGCCLGPYCCLLYEYMLNGSLEDRLACKEQSEPLSWQTRLSVSYGSALGINHLHTFLETPMVHRDIKSANILLNQHFVPKVGDFGLVRIGNSGESTTLVVTGKCIGTTCYMPREAFEGDVSVKWDTFSFGVVLLELLTGLPPYDWKREDKLLAVHMVNCKDIISMLDPKAKWNKKAATELYRTSQRCLAQSKRFRPTISEA